MQKTILLIVGLIMLLAGACSADDQFRVNGVIEGKPTMNLRAGYYADGKYKTIITAVREGEFEFFGSAGQPTILEITDYDYRPIARLYVQNGQTYDVTLEQGRPYSLQAKGNEENERWSAFLRDNAKALEQHTGNAKIEAYIRSNPQDVVSTILLLTEYDAAANAAMADSLLMLIDPEARPSSLSEGYSFIIQRVADALAENVIMPLKYIDSADSLKNFNPAKQQYSIITLSTQTSSRNDSIVPALRRLRKQYKASRLGILDFSLDGDTAIWKRAARQDSATWKQGWVAGGLAGMSVAQFGAPALPYIIICDSTGHQVLRTPYTGEAEKYLNSLLSK